MGVNHRQQITARRVSEAAILLLTPAVLAIIYYLTPLSFQQQLVLDHTAPQIHAFWTNALVHEHRPRDSHLLGNLIGYTLLVFPCWLLYLYRGQNRRFWIGLALILAVGPLIASLSSYLAFHEILGLQIRNDRGFSGVVGAIDGFLIMTILGTFAQQQEEPVAMLSTGLYFGYLITGLGAVTLRVPFLGFGLLIVAITYAATRTAYVARPEELAAWGENHRSLSTVLVIAALVSALVFATALPTNIVTDSNGLKNIVAHGAGIIFGMAVAASLRNSTRTEMTDESSTV